MHSESLTEALESFIADGLVAEALYPIKSGKEATVYCCSADRSTREWVSHRTAASRSVLSAGAYGMSMASQYNGRPRPAEVLVSGARFRVVRRRETVDDLVRGETV